jgi:oligoribonuclease (3'-5' exoribonuclease)
MARRDNLVWIDLEMTGLDPEEDVILEMLKEVLNRLPANINKVYCSLAVTYPHFTHIHTPLAMA